MLIMALLPRRRIAHGPSSTQVVAESQSVAQPAVELPRTIIRVVHKCRRAMAVGRASPSHLAWSKGKRGCARRNHVCVTVNPSFLNLRRHKTIARGTSQATVRRRGPATGNMLPRLDFHSSLRDAVLDGRKTATTRLVGELDLEFRHRRPQARHEGRHDL